jgi:glycosyltransferase involved in cell wall biosynthesis
MTTVLIDGRLAIRGLGIASFVDRLMAALSSEPSVAPFLWMGKGGWGPAGLLSTMARSGPFDVSPKLDPRTRRFDVVHLASNLGSVFPGRASVVTVHDLLYRKGRRRDLVMGRVLETCLGRASRIVAISGRTKASVEEALPQLAGRVEVIPHGMRRLPSPTGPRGHVLAFGGAADPRKRTDLMVAAYRSYRGSTPDALPLVVLARAGLTPGQRAALAELGAQVVSSATAAEVDTLMAGAAALLYTTTTEGFGLPILEAAELGTPVIIDASAQVADEVVGAHCFQVEGSEPEAWGRRLRDAVDHGPVVGALDLPDWTAVAGRYAALYREVAGS